jgi:uncharacterized small protein (DUF1192 family)
VKHLETGGEMARVTIAQATKAGFSSRAGLYRAIHAGKLALTEEGGKKVLDVADLVRVFGEPSQRPVKATQIAAAPDLGIRAELEKRVQELVEEKARLEHELSKERDASREAVAAAAQERAKLLELVENGQKALAERRRSPGRKRLAG